MATRGRPSFKPTGIQRRKVAAAKAGGMTEDAIALALGISTTTLRKHFELELSVGAAQKRLEVVDALFAQAKRGNVAAIKAAMLLVGATEPAQPPAPGEEAAGPAPAPSARLGKKEAAQIAARSAADGTDWAGLLPSSSSVQ